MISLFALKTLIIFKVIISTSADIDIFSLLALQFIKQKVLFRALDTLSLFSRLIKNKTIFDFFVQNTLFLIIQVISLFAFRALIGRGVLYALRN